MLMTSSGSTSNLISQFICRLSTQFDMNDLGPLSFFLGTETKYALPLLQQYGMDGSKPVATPTTGDRLSSSYGDLFSDPTEYWTLIGSLQRFDMPKSCLCCQSLVSIYAFSSNQSPKKNLKLRTLTHGLLYCSNFEWDLALIGRDVNRNAICLYRRSSQKTTIKKCGVSIDVTLERS